MGRIDAFRIIPQNIQVKCAAVTLPTMQMIPDQISDEACPYTSGLNAEGFNDTQGMPSCLIGLDETFKLIQVEVRNL